VNVTLIAPVSVKVVDLIEPVEAMVAVNTRKCVHVQRRSLVVPFEIAFDAAENTEIALLQVPLVGGGGGGGDCQ
jgi:hypothetical protein